jgi:hypothetical protein
MTERPALRAVDSTVYCHAEMRVHEIVLSVCGLQLGHREQDGTPHADGCTRWGHDDRPHSGR